MQYKIVSSQVYSNSNILLRCHLVSSTTGLVQLIPGSNEGDGKSEDEIGSDLGAPDNLVRRPCKGKMMVVTVG